MPPRDENGRGARRRRQTRTRLIDAARAVMARKGVGATSIQEITEAADVGFGSFYNHFPSKEAIAEAVMEESVESFGTAADRIADAVDDPAEVLAASIRYAILRVAADETWGRFLVRTSLAQVDGLKRGLGKRLARDIRTGIKARRFEVEDGLTATLAAAGVLLAIMAARLHCTLGKDAPERAALIVLKMLGLSEKEARHIASRPLPPIALPDSAATH